MKGSSMKAFWNSNKKYNKVKEIYFNILICPNVWGLGPNLGNSPILAPNRIFYDFAVLRNIRRANKD